VWFLPFLGYVSVLKLVFESLILALVFVGLVLVLIVVHEGLIIVLVLVAVLVPMVVVRLDSPIWRLHSVGS